MQKLQRMRFISIISSPIALALFIVLLYIKPAIARSNPQYKYLFIWVALATVGSSWIRKVYYNLLEEIGDDTKIEELLSRRGKISLRKAPDNFFTETQLRRYKIIQRGQLVFFMLLIGLFYLLIYLAK